MQRGIAPALCEEIKRVFKEAGAALGANPLEPSTMLGPIVDQQQFERIMSYIEIGKKTATLVAGGQRKGDKGCFIEPTLFLNPDPESPVVKEEIFGPVMTIQTFETEEEAIQMANNTSYGLAGTCICLLWTRKLGC